MRRRTVVLSGVLLRSALLGSSRASTARPVDEFVNIDNFSFSPVELRIVSGTKITWSNRDDIPHTVTDAGKPCAFRSEALDTGDSYSHVFDAVGIYRYFCSLHPQDSPHSQIAPNIVA